MTYQTQRAPYVFPFSRFLLSLIFLVSGVNKLITWNSSVAMMVDRGVPFARFFLGAATAVEIVAGLALFFGTYARHAAMVLFLYLIPVTLVFHGFWNLTGPAQTLQAVNFLKNMAILGGLLQVVGNGAGAFSVDEARERLNQAERMRRAEAERKAA